MLMLGILALVLVGSTSQQEVASDFISKGCVRTEYRADEVKKIVHVRDLQSLYWWIQLVLFHRRAKRVNLCYTLRSPKCRTPAFTTESDCLWNYSTGSDRPVRG
jgi:hypothetical protein